MDPFDLSSPLCIPMNTSSDAGREIPAYAGMT